MTQATRLTLRMLAERVEQLTGQIDELNQRLTRVVVYATHAQQLLERVGIGPDSAVMLLITMGDNLIGIKGQGPTLIRPFLRTPNKDGYAVFNTGLKQRVEDRTELGPGA